MFVTSHKIAVFFSCKLSLGKVLTKVGICIIMVQ